MTPRTNLLAFDFDNTLVVSDSEVIVQHANGKTSHLDPYEYAVYKEQPGDQFDFSQFEKLINPKRIEKYHRILKAAIQSPNTDVMILSARGNPSVIRHYLRELGIPDDHVEVAAVGSSSPEAKSKILKSLIAERGYKDVHFFDDSEHNDAEIRGIKDTGARVNTHLVPKHQYQSLAKKQPQQFDASKIQKILNTRIRNPETGNNILIKTALKYDRQHPVHRLARQTILRYHKRK